jgi:hypothetical protein
MQDRPSEIYGLMVPLEGERPLAPGSDQLERPQGADGVL